MNSTKELHIGGRQADGRGIRKLRNALAQAFDALAGFLEPRPWVGFIVILALYLVYLKTHATSFLPWHDELFTYYLSQAPTFGQMIRETQTIDLNPPLSYIVTRLSFALLHPSSFSLRLPSMVAFPIAAFCVYVFVERRLSRIYGFLGALVLLGSVYKMYAFEARPYALALCFLGIAAVGWQLTIDENDGLDGNDEDNKGDGSRRKRWLGLFLLLLGGFGMLLSHVLALVAYGAFFLAELVRFAQRKKPDWPLWICLVLPLSSTYFYLPLFSNHGAGAFPPIFQSSFLRVTEGYGAVWVDLASLLAAAMIAIVLLGYAKASLPEESPASQRTGFSTAEATFAIYLLFVPLMVALEFMRSHAAYFDRYGMAAIFGAGILLPWLIAAWTRSNRGAGLLAACIFAFGLVPPIAFVTYTQKWLHPAGINNPDLTGISSVPLSQVDPGLPLVDASGLTFLEMNSRESAAFLSRVYYLNDLQAALQYSHATIFEGFGGLRQIFPIRASVAPYQQFIRQHPTFLVYGAFDYPEDWLLRKLMADGAIVRYVGDFPRGYKDSTLYEVTVPQK